MGPLQGFKVLDLTAMISGPVASMMLADQGAQVIKVEPLHGDHVRHMGSSHNGLTAAFFSSNRGKQSIAINLKSPQGKDILNDLIKQSDVLMQNFRPGVMDKMGFGETAVRKLKKDIVYLSISGFGDKGPYSNKKVYDPVIQALSGATDFQADRATGKPAMFRIIVADKVTALTAAQAITSALVHRERTGQGQHIKLSMIDSLVSFFWPEGMGGVTYADKQRDLRAEQGTMDLIFETKDRLITAGAITNIEWKGMCTALNREDLIDDPRFATPNGRIKNLDIRKQLIATEIAKWESDEILQRFDENEVPSAPLLMREELLDHEQIVANGTITSLNYPEYGEVRQPTPPARFSETPSEIKAPAPKLGEHTKQILQNLGYDEKKCENLIETGIVAAISES